MRTPEPVPFCRRGCPSPKPGICGNPSGNCRLSRLAAFSTTSIFTTAGFTCLATLTKVRDRSAGLGSVCCCAEAGFSSANTHTPTIASASATASANTARRVCSILFSRFTPIFYLQPYLKPLPRFEQSENTERAADLQVDRPTPAENPLSHGWPDQIQTFLATTGSLSFAR